MLLVEIFICLKKSLMCLGYKEMYLILAKNYLIIKPVLIFYLLIYSCWTRPVCITLVYVYIIFTVKTKLQCKLIFYYCLNCFCYYVKIDRYEMFWGEMNHIYHSWYVRLSSVQLSCHSVSQVIINLIVISS